MVKLTVLTREVSPAISRCELTCIDRQQISYTKTVKQHDAYVAVFEEFIKEGYNLELIRLPALEMYPDCMFMEDVAMFYEDFVIITRPSAPGRQGEEELILRWAERLRPGHVHRIQAPGCVDGGDVFPVGRFIFVGKSTRTNDDAFHQIQSIVASYRYTDRKGQRHPYEVVRLPVKGRLHIKTAGSFLDEETILMDTNACDAEIFTSRGIRVLAPPNGEESGSNPLVFNVEEFARPDRKKRVIVLNEGVPETRKMVEEYAEKETQAGRKTVVKVIEMDEIAKAEGSLTCLSLLAYENESPSSQCASSAN